MSLPAASDPASSTPIEKLTTQSRIAIGAVLALTFVLRGRMLEIPLGRDEGVYAYIGWLILQDIPLYTSTVDLQMPGLWAFYAALMSILGVSGVGVHLGLLICNLVSVWCVFLLGRWLFGAAGGVVAAACFSALSLSQSMLGFTANAEHFVLVFSLAGLVLLVRGARTNRAHEFFVSGLLLGLGLMMKQHGVFFVSFGGVFTLYALAGNTPLLGRANAVRALLYGTGALVPIAFTASWFAVRGVLGEFVFWSFQYSSTYGFNRGIDDALRALEFNALPIVPHTIGFCVLAAIGLIGAIGGMARREVGEGDRLRAPFVIGFFLFSAATVFPGLVFRQHYFLMVAPAVAILCAAGVDTLVRTMKIRSGRSAAIAAFAATLLVVGQWIAVERDYLFRHSPDDIARNTYQLNPIVELRQVGAYLNARTTPDDRIAVLGSEPQIFLYANRLSAATLIVMYPMLWAPPEMALELQRKTISEIEAANPKFLIAVDNATSWAFEEHSNRMILHWAEEYVRRGYFLVGIVEVGYPGSSTFVWGQQAVQHKPSSRSVIRIYERRDAVPRD